MKKTMLVLLTLIFTALMVLASAEGVEVSPGKLVGTWYGSTASFSTDLYSLVGDVRIEFNRDKSALLVLNDVQHQMTWEVDTDQMKIRFDLNDETAMQFDPYGFMNTDGSITLHGIEDGTIGSRGPLQMEYTFTRENGILVPPALANAEAEDELFGNYKAVYLLEGNKAIFVPEGTDILLRVDFAEAEFTESEKKHIYLTEFENGVIVFDGDQALNNAHIQLSLTTDEQMIAAVISTEEATGAIYFQKRAN